ncbi:unnamed protein product [Closterium sp. NIES-65]|nr:unnamed protein product [Closterium sp. NIES-65]
MVKPKARPSATGASKGKTPGTRRVSSKASRPSSAGRMRLLTRDQGDSPGQTQQASPLRGGRARARHQERPAQGRSGEDSAASPLPLPRPRTVPLATSPQPPSPAAPDKGGAGPVRTRATSSTSPRAQRAAQRGKASRQQEQQREELAGQGGVAALGEPVDGAAVAGVGETGSREDASAEELGLTLRMEAVVNAGADSTEAVRVTHWSAAGTFAASDNNLIPPAVTWPAATPPLADEDLGADEAQAEQGPADSPAPVVAESPPALEESMIAAVVAEAARRQGQPPSEVSVPTAAGSAGTFAAAAAASRQEHVQAVGGIEEPGCVSAEASAEKGARWYATSFQPASGTGRRCTTAAIREITR